MEENNKNQNSYTGEYGNSVEGTSPPDTSVYSYSYKDGDNSATHSGDYYAGRDNSYNNPGQQEVSPQQPDNLSQPIHDNSYNSNYNNNYGSSYTEQNNKNQNKKSEWKGKKFLITAVCAVLFGIVAGVCFEAVRYVSDSVFGITAEEPNKIGTTTNSNSDNKTSTSKSNNPVVVKGAVTDVSGIVEQTLPAIVAITSTSEGVNYYDLFGGRYQQDQTSCGSGFIVGQSDKELLIATNNHVIDNANTISVQFIDDEVYEAKVKGTAASNDLAVIAVKVNDISSSTMDKIKIADLGSSDSLKVGEMAIAIGNSLGYGQSVTVGYISAKDREISEDADSRSKTSNKIKVIQTDAAINPGNSGGALINLNGQVIGINSAKIADSSVEGVGYAIPISVATPIIDELMNREELSDSEKGYLGVSVETVTEEASQYNIPNGAYVRAVSEGSAADKAGIKAGDIITCINNMEVTTKESLSEKVNSYRKGTEIEVTFQRSNDGEYEERKVTVKLQGQESLDGLPSDNSQSNQGNNRNQYGNDSDDGLGNGGYDIFDDFFNNPFGN